MAEKEIIQVEIVLDGKKYVTDLQKAEKQTKKSFDSNQTKQFNDGLKKMALRAGALATAFLSTKTAIESVFDYDRLRSTEHQFDILTKKAGLSGDTLKKGMLQAADGLLSTNDVLKLANQSLVAFGSEAKRLPELLELAHKASTLTGEGFQETFKRLSDGVRQGSADTLKQFGIILDTNQVLREYAESIGTSVSALTSQAKATAVLNATLDQGKRAYKGVNTGIAENIDAYEQTKVALQELKESIGAVLNTNFGDWWRNLAQSVRDWAKLQTSKNMDEVAAASGDAAARLRVLLRELNGVNEALEKIDPTGFEGFKIPGLEEQRRMLEGQIKDTQSVINLQKRLGKERELASGDPQNLIDENKALESNLKLQSSLLAMRQAHLSIMLERNEAVIATTAKEEELELALGERVRLAKQENAFQLEAIEFEHKSRLAELNNLTELTENERNQRILEAKRMLGEQQLAMERVLQAELTEIMAQNVAARQAIYDRQIQQSTSAGDQFIKGFSKNAKKAMQETDQMAKLGESAASALASNMSNAFERAGQAGFVFGQEMKKAVIGAIADVAAAQGRTWLAMGLIPGNQLYFAAGAALLALSSVLRAAAGGGGGGGGAVAAPAAAPAGPSPTFRSAEDDRAPIDTEEQKKKSVNIQVMGNIYETEETRMKLVEMIREAADATDYKIQSVGGGL